MERDLEALYRQVTQPHRVAASFSPEWPIITAQVLQEDLCHLVLSNSWVLKVEQKSTLLQPRSPITLVCFLWVMCFPGEEQPYILVCITKISPRPIHLFLSSRAKSVELPRESSGMTDQSEPRLQGTVTEFAVLISSVSKTAFPHHVQTEPLGTPTALADCLSPAPLGLGAGVQE